MTAYGADGKEQWHTQALLEGCNLAVSPKGDRVAVAGYPGLLVLDAKDGHVLGGHKAAPYEKGEVPPADKMLAAAWNDKGTLVAAGWAFPNPKAPEPAVVLDADGKEVSRPKVNGPVMGVAFVPGTDTLLIGADQLTAVDAKDGKPLWTNAIKGAQAFAFTADGKTGAAGGWGKNAGAFTVGRRQGRRGRVRGGGRRRGVPAERRSGRGGMGRTHPLYAIGGDKKAEPLFQSRFGFQNVAWSDALKGLVAAEEGGKVWLLDADGKPKAMLDETAGTTAYRLCASRRRRAVGADEPRRAAGQGPVRGRLAATRQRGARARPLAARARLTDAPTDLPPPAVDQVQRKEWTLPTRSTCSCLPSGNGFASALGEPTAPQRQGWPLIASGQKHAHPGADRLRQDAGRLPRLPRSPLAAGGAAARRARPLRFAAQGAQQRHRPQPATAAPGRGRNGPTHGLEAAGPASRGSHRRHARRRTAAPGPQAAARPHHHAGIAAPAADLRARDTLRGVTHCIIDEIHALCPNKRGVFLALLLERLAAINPRGFVRIGLSATQRPLEEVARFLGGAEPDAEGRLVPRPVAVVDAGLRKDLDLRVVSPVEAFGPIPEGSVWPSIYRLLGDLIREHRSTIVFANDRRSVERITAFLNDEGEIARAHHGSVSLEVRQEVEAALKEGRLPAVVATASLEMGIDMGAVDLVCQVGSPGNVARALQRVGRAGHLVGQTSKGRLIPKTPADLLEQAVLAREMTAGRVEAIRTPINCLDVLAQQVVALAAMDDWAVPDLYALVRRAYPYRDLSPQAFETTLEMVSGRYRFAERRSASRERERAEAVVDLHRSLTGGSTTARLGRWKRCNRASAGTASTTACSPCPAAGTPPWSTAASFPTWASTPPTPATACASANWTRSSSTSAASATPSCWAPTPGGSTASRPIA